MKAVECQQGELRVVDRPEPTPGRGQVRIGVLRCGICGSDLHARHGMNEWAGLAAALGYDRFGRLEEPIVFGHEFCGEVLEHGPKVRDALAVGTRVVALPLLRNGDHIDTTGLSIHAPGGYADQMLVQDSMMLPVPNGLDADLAALTEPLAVAWHAVRRGEVGRRTQAIVVGCGPIGLAVILMLKARGVRMVIASDPSAGRRELATRCGADVVVDPGADTPFAAGPEAGHLRSAPEAFELALSTREKLARLPVVPWWQTWRLAETLGAKPKHPVIFECVGVPGMIETVIQGAPLFSRVVVVGVCVGEDRFTPAMGINKEIDLRFVLGYTPLEFRDTLHMLADGKLDPRPLLTGRVGLGGVERAFAALGNADRHAKILVDPLSDAAEPV